MGAGTATGAIETHRKNSTRAATLLWEIVVTFAPISVSPAEMRTRFCSSAA